MKQNKISMRLLLVGVGPRLTFACLVVAAIWLGFFWATARLVAL